MKAGRTTGEGKDKTRDREPRTGKIRYQLSYQSVIFAVTQFSGWEARGQLRLREREGRGGFFTTP